MTFQQIIDYCLTKPGAYLDYPFDPMIPVVKVKAPSHAAWRIFAEPFVLRGEAKLTLRCTPVTAELYRAAYPGSVVRGWHCPPVQQPHKNTISLDGSLSDALLYEMIDHSYAVAVSRMPKIAQQELNEVKIY
ncbi:MAG: MmcQ/YjbR family DNA-binding protein [Oscillospiraceae bacterium]|jgi:predicted DNA-binding protein (MmcQ/YjbR family)|nr:MmcQ/YjbR family DNA-binding protein [Oscillospiraceae bacterium]